MTRGEMLQDWEWAFLDAVIAKDFTEALRNYYRNEGEQISMWEV